MCHAVRAPGVKCTLAAPVRDWMDGAAIVSRYTAPVNQSLGPGFVSSPFLVICMLLSFVVRRHAAVTASSSASEVERSR